MKHDVQPAANSSSRHRKMQDEFDSRASESAQLAKKRFSISSRVIPGLMIALDSFVILSSALISYALSSSILENPSYYAAAIAFVWLVTIMLMNFAGLYRFEAITRPLAYVDKMVIVFVTTFCFSIGGSIRTENLYRVFPYLDR